MLPPFPVSLIRTLHALCPLRPGTLHLDDILPAPTAQYRSPFPIAPPPGGASGFGRDEKGPLARTSGRVLVSGVRAEGLGGSFRQLLVCDTHLSGLSDGCSNAPEYDPVTLSSSWFDVHDQQVLAQGFVTDRSAHAEDEREGVYASDRGVPGCAVAGMACLALLYCSAFLSSARWRLSQSSHARVNSRK
eukprot:3177433-Rhodomonas_salina.1